MELSTDEERVVFYPDQFASTKQQQQLETLIEEQLGTVVAHTASSKQKSGIQTADCLAGGIREQKSGGEPWLDHLSEPVSVPNQNYWALTQLEHRLSNE